MSENEKQDKSGKWQSREKRSSYLSPSREGKVTITAHVDPELKQAVTKLADQSNLTFNEFITTLLKRVVNAPAQKTDSTLKISEDALAQTRELEKTIHQLTLELASHNSSPNTKITEKPRGQRRQ